MSFNPEKYIEDKIKDLEKNTEGNFLITVSGGIDSSVSAILIKKAKLTNELIFIDTGFLRFNESNAAKKTFQGKVKIIDVRKEFYQKLKNKISPAEKRETFTQVYFKIIKDYAIKNKFSHIVQGTQFYKTSTKRYHNSPTDEFLKSKIKIIEPVKGLKKDQIRLIAKKINLPKEIINRRPFPGPGLLIRFGGKYQKDKLDLIRKITFVVDKFVEQNKKEFENCYQIFPYLTTEYAPFVNKHNKGSIGPIVLIRAISDYTIKNSIIYKPFIFSNNLREKLVDKIMSLGNISRVCFDSTFKNGFGNNVKRGGTIEYA